MKKMKLTIWGRVGPNSRKDNEYFKYLSCKHAILANPDWSVLGDQLIGQI